MTKERYKELKSSLSNAYSISGDPELVDVDEHVKCYEEILELIEGEFDRQWKTCFTCRQIEDKHDTEIIIRYSFGDYDDMRPDYCPSCGREL